MRRTDQPAPIVRGEVPDEPSGDIWMESAPIGDDGSIQWHPDGADVPDRAVGMSIALLGFVLLFVLALIYVFGGIVTAGPPVPLHTPTTYGPPPTVVH